MKNIINCITDNNPVIKKKLREVSVEEGLAIATKLFQILNERKDGIGLAANQVGIDAQVAVVNVIEPLVLINPKIISKENPFTFFEGCLSYPGQGVSTQRYRDIVVQTAQEECGWYFSGAESLQDVRGQWEEQHKKDEQEKRILESVCVQHEIDHLNGITVFDRQVNNTPVQRQVKKYGRNEKVTIQKGSETRILKYKKAQNFLKQGWEIL
jgi:peptide deformylase